MSRANVPAGRPSCRGLPNSLDAELQIPANRQSHSARNIQKGPMVANRGPIKDWAANERKHLSPRCGNRRVIIRDTLHDEACIRFWRRDRGRDVRPPRRRYRQEVPPPLLRALGANLSIGTQSAVFAAMNGG